MRSALLAAVLLVPPPGAANCSGCHAAGSGNVAINGRDAGEIAGLMTAYRSGPLASTAMGRLMKGLAPSDIEGIAGWVATQK